MIKGALKLMLVILIGLIVIGVDAQITGKAQQEDVNVGLTVGNTAPTVISWEEPLDGFANYGPTEGTITTVQFDVTIGDANGFADLSGGLSSVVVDISQGGEPTRNGACSSIGGSETATTLDFSCSVDMQYYDLGGASNPWTITVTATDSSGDSGNMASDGTASFLFFTYSTLLSIQTDTNSISFSSITESSTNIDADNSITVSNTGNVAISASSTSWISVVGQELLGVAVPTNLIDADSFGVDESDSPDACTGTQQLVDSTAVNVNGGTLSRGDYLTLPAANRELFYCLISINPTSGTPVPPDSYQTSVAGGGPWSIEVSE